MAVWTDERFCSTAQNTSVLPGHCFFSRLDPFNLEINHDKFQLTRIGNG